MWTILSGAGRALAQAKPAFVALALALHLAGLVLNGERWRLVVAALGSRLSLARATLINLAGVFVRNATPTTGLGGDASRIALLTLDGVPMPEASASFAYVRLAELPSVIALVAVSVPIAASRLTASAWWLVAVVAVVAAVAWLMRGALRRRLSGLTPYVERLRIGPPVVGAAVGYAALSQLEAVLRLMAVAAAFGMALSPQAAIAVTALTIAGGLVPTVGSLGAIDGALAGGLMAFGAPAQTAIAITIVERAISYGLTTALGAAALTMLGGRAVLMRAKA